MKDAEMIAREEYEAHRSRVNRATDREMALTLPKAEINAEAGFIAKIKREAFLAGYEAAREQAAKVADAETGKTPHGNYDYGPNVAHRIRAAIRNMEPDNVAP